MCGILGGSKRNWNYEAGIAAIRHRGPDMQRIIREDEFSLAFARLSIIDLSDAAMQPMTSMDGKVTVVYNGEIYGYGKLKEKLEKKYQFFSASDTEVILNAYMEYGDKFVDYVDGIFAVAIYDRRNWSVRMFRDRIGVKPLYYYYDGFYFAFSSELKAINKLLEKQTMELDYTALYDYLTYAYVPAPKTMYQNVRQLKPAHKIIYKIKNHQLSPQKRFWELPVNGQVDRHRKDKELTGELRELIHQSVQEQMIADVPVGTFLSGGVDSSVVTYECLLEKPDVESFSIGFTDEQYDESKYYKAFIQKFGNNSNEQIFDKCIFTELYREAAGWFDEPFADTSAYPTYLVSKLAKEKVTVVLTGDGGDELFGGYGWYGYDYRPGILGDGERISRFYENLVIRNKRLYFPKAGELLYETMQKFCAAHYYGLKSMKTDAANRWGIPKDYDDYWFVREYDRKELPIITRLQYIDLHTYLPRILTKVDRTSMQVSLEARVPLLSRRVVEFAFSLSQEERCPGGEMKHMLQKTYPEIPKSILYRKKQGFCIPEQYLRSPGRKSGPNEKILREVWKIR